MNLAIFLAAALTYWCSVRCVQHRLLLLHTNDMHAHFEEVDQYASSCTPSDAEAKKCYGGFARIREAAIEAKEEARRNNISSIFLNAGDTFQGTAYYTVYKWRMAASVVNTLGFDVMCLGNHEFDDGIDNLVEYLAHVKTPTVAANLNRSSEHRLNETNVKNSHVLDVDGVKIGIVGYLTPQTMISSKTENLKIFEEIPHIKKEAKRLKSNGVKVVIALGHSGLRMDKHIAREVQDIDIIVGGHSHSLLYTPRDQQPNTERIEDSYPCWVRQKSGKRVPIVQSSAFTKYFGKLMVTFDDDWKVIAAEGNSHLLDYKYKKDVQTKHLVESWTVNLRAYLRTVVASTRVMLKKSEFRSSDFESNIGNLITDSFFEKGVSYAKEINSTQWTEHAIAIYQAKGIRSQISNEKNAGNFTIEDVLMVLPFENEMYQCRLTGQNLKNILELSVMEYEPKERIINFFLYFSGLRVTYDLKRSPGDRVVSILVLCTNCSVPKYEILDKNNEYLIIVTDYLLRGGDNYFILKTSCMDIKNLKFHPYDAVIDYSKKREVIYPILDGRIKVLGYEDTISRATYRRISFYPLLLAFLIITEVVT